MHISSYLSIEMPAGDFFLILECDEYVLIVPWSGLAFISLNCTSILDDAKWENILGSQIAF